MMLRLIQKVKCFVTPAYQIKKISTTSPKRNVFHKLPNLVFGKYLLHTNVISSGVLLWLGDLCQQEIEFRQGILAKRYDYGRMARMFAVGIAAGPLHHYYYIYIARIMPKRNLATVFTKVGLDQFVMSPLYIGLFFYGMGALEMKPVKKINEEIVDKFMKVFVMDCCVWVPTQFVNFCFVPVKYQVFYINAVTMLYNVFLSAIKHKDTEHLADNESLMVESTSDKK